MQPTVELAYNASGYLLIAAQAARQFFPTDTLVLAVRGDELWLLPTRGAAAGGLFLKQRNSSGDRSVLAAPFLPEETPPGTWLAFWDEREGALRAAFRLPKVQLEPGIAAKALVQPESGRWVVYLEVGFASNAEGIAVERKRIGDYSTEQRARVAADWIERTADRDLTRPNPGI